MSEALEKTDFAVWVVFINREPPEKVLYFA